jgi:creatinine amidohydrolase
MGYSIFDETMVDMTWTDIEKVVQEGAIALLPTGVIEEHGPHMGLAVDIYIAYLLCKLTRRELETKGMKTLIAPPYYWGINNATGSFPGSFTFRKETTKTILYEILSSLHRWGLTHVFNINHHNDIEHNIAILEAIKEARVDTGVRAYLIRPDWYVKRLGLTGKEEYILVEKSPPSPIPPPKYLDIHAGERETGIMAHYFPNQVNIGLAKELKSTDFTNQDLAVFRLGWSDARKLTPLGYFGDPAGFDLENSKRLIETRAKDLANLIESFVKGTYGPPQIE